MNAARSVLSLSYQHRSKWLDEVGASASADMWWDTSERLDFSGRYYVRDNLSLYVDANNLTDELGRRYQGPTERTYELEGFGRRFMVGVRANF